MINVLHLINYPGWGSTERNLIAQAEKLKEDCRFYLGYVEEGPLLKQAADLGVQAVRIPAGSPFNGRAALRVRDLSRDLAIDIVHSHSLRENIAAGLSRVLGNKAVIIATNHLIRRSSLLLMAAGRPVGCLTDKFIAVSAAVARQTEQTGVRHDKIEVINYGVDTGYWSGKRNFLFRREMNIGREEYVITTVSNFSDGDGLIFLLETVKLLKKLSYSGGKLAWRNRFVIVGDGEMMDECRKFAGMLGISDDVVFTGSRSDIKNIYLSSDLYVSARENEAPGLEILEAMSCELPVIAVSGSGASALVDGPDGCGLSVDYGDTEGFARAIMEMVVNMRIYNHYKANTSRIVKEKYNLDMNVRQTYNLYIRLLEEKQRSMAIT